jgi:hypothetical protein
MTTDAVRVALFIALAYVLGAVATVYEVGLAMHSIVAAINKVLAL